MMRVVVILVALLFSPMVIGYNKEGGGGEGGRRFIMEEAEQVVKTDAGEVRVVRGHTWYGHPNPMHIGRIRMEPNSMFIPQYADANLILFVQKGEAKIGWIYDDGLVVKRFKPGDINRIPAGSSFYIVNTSNRQRLHIIFGIDTTSDYSSWDESAPPYQSFFLGGGLHPRSVLAGFDIGTLTTAFNVTTEEVGALTGSRTAGPIVYITGEPANRPHHLTSLLYSKLKKAQREVYSISEVVDVEESNQEYRPWSLTRLFNSILGENKKSSGPVGEPDSYNLFGRDPSFRNNYGWSVALDQHDYRALKHSDIGVYYVNLTAGSMVAPHFNPQATEYGVVLRGRGRIQVVYPNGTLAMNTEVSEGDVFWIPRFFPFCQVASRGGQFEFFGFTTSARTNHPQFLVGESSVLKAMIGSELAKGMGVSEDLLRRLVMAQKESVILPTWVLPWEKEEAGEGGRGEEGKESERERGREEERERERGREEESKRGERERERGREEEKERERGREEESERGREKEQGEKEREREKGREEEQGEKERERERGREEERERERGREEEREREREEEREEKERERERGREEEQRKMEKEKERERERGREEEQGEKEKEKEMERERGREEEKERERERERERGREEKQGEKKKEKEKEREEEQGEKEKEKEREKGREEERGRKEEQGEKEREKEKEREEEQGEKEKEKEIEKGREEIERERKRGREEEQGEKEKEKEREKGREEEREEIERESERGREEEQGEKEREKEKEREEEQGEKEKEKEREKGREEEREEIERERERGREEEQGEKEKEKERERGREEEREEIERERERGREEEKERQWEEGSGVVFIRRMMHA